MSEHTHLPKCPLAQLGAAELQLQLPLPGTFPALCRNTSTALTNTTGSPGGDSPSCFARQKSHWLLFLLTELRADLSCTERAEVELEQCAKHFSGKGGTRNPPGNERSFLPCQCPPGPLEILFLQGKGAFTDLPQAQTQG